MHSMEIALVRLPFLLLYAYSHCQIGLSSEIAVSLNSNEVRIYARQGNDWNHTETLSEVRVIYTLPKFASTHVVHYLFFLPTIA